MAQGRKTKRAQLIFQFVDAFFFPMSSLKKIFEFWPIFRAGEIVQNANNFLSEPSSPETIGYILTGMTKYVVLFLSFLMFAPRFALFVIRSFCFPPL